MAKKEKIIREMALPMGVSASIEKDLVQIKGPKGEVKRIFRSPALKVTILKDKIILESSKNTRKEKMILNTFRAHLLNIVQGVQENHTYKLKICSGHFPMNVAVVGKELVIKNFLGENKPRKVGLPAQATVKVEGNEIIVSSPDIEIAGQTAAKIESLCRITNRDVRIFQDGCYITQKPEKSN